MNYQVEEEDYPDVELIEAEMEMEISGNNLKKS